MSKLKIFLADLSHNYVKTGLNESPFMPLAVGLIGSYAKKIFGDSIEIRLFKYPEKLYKALNEEHCDVLGCSTYMWNSNISHWACRVLKRKNPNSITILGGPDFVKDHNLKLEYFKNHDYIDLRALFEGELAFSNLIKLILKYGIKNKDKIFNEKIDNCVYLDRNKNLLVQGKSERVQFLDEIPSPYITGMLDEFFDGRLGPIIQTTRGCPFTCNFCLESDAHYSRVKNFQTQYSIDELDYIGKKVFETQSDPGTVLPAYLDIADSNYGMYKRDVRISEKILELHQKYNWPQNITLSTGKHFDRVLETTYILKDMFDYTLSVQSMDQNVLEAIGRKNLPPQKYKNFAATLRKKGTSTLSETLIPLPKESLKSFFKGMEELMDLKVTRIVSNTLIFLKNTDYENKQYLDKYGYTTKYRLIPRQFGIYEGEKIFEVEKVGVSTDTMNFKDYLETRRYAFIVEMLYSSKIFEEVEFFVEDYNLKYHQYVFFAYQELKKAHKDITRVMQSLEDQSINELKEDEESLIKYYSEKSKFQKAVSGDEGGNVKYLHKALLLSKYQNVWLEFAFNCLKNFLVKNNVKIKEDFDDLVAFIKCKFNGILDLKTTNTKVNHSFNYDIIEWFNQKERSKALVEFKKPSKTKIKFTYDTDQTQGRSALLNIYTDNDVSSITSILLSIRPQQEIFRKYEYSEQNVSNLVKRDNIYMAENEREQEAS